jgi:hypothetical protein
MALGLVDALRRDHVAVGFIKPIMQPADRGTANLSTHFARELLHLDVPNPLSFAAAEARVRAGGLEALLEDLVPALEVAGAGCDAVVVPFPRGMAAGLAHRPDFRRPPLLVTTDHRMRRPVAYLKRPIYLRVAASAVRHGLF